MKINLQVLVILGLLMLITFGSYSQQKGTVTDIDGNTYQTVVIGDQEWMAENLRVAKFNNGDAIPNIQSVEDWTSGSYPLKWANYNNSSDNDAIYGKLYDGRVVTDTRNVCPDGWHVATKDDWDAMISYLGGTTIAGNKIMDNSGNYWSTPNDATNETGFTAVPSGYRSSDGSFLSLTYASEIWTSTAVSTISNNYVYLHYSGSLSITDGMTYGAGRAIRCIKTQEPTVELPTLTTTTVTNITQTTASSGGAITDDGGADITAKGVVWSTSTSPTLDANNGFTADGTGTTEFNSDLTGLTAGATYYVRAYATNSAGTGYGNEVQFSTYSENVIEDFEGNLYNTVTIGNQQWMAENLRATKYADGTSIPTGFSDTDWNTTTNGTYAIYPHSEVDGLNSEEDVINAYGLLYNWFAVSNEKGICPTGWKVPSVAEWDELLTFLIDEGYSNSSSATTNGAGNALKSCRQVDSPLGGDCATSEHPRWDYYADHYGTDAFGFNGLPAGSRMSTGEYLNVGKMGRFWTSDEDDLNQYNAVRRDLGFGYGILSDGSITKTNGISIRCIKESEVQVVVPQVVTTAVTNITQTTASSGGAITDDGGAVITAKGVVWSTLTNPTLASNSGSTSDGTGTAEFNSDLTGLTAGTTYYVRAYATNSAGTGYGNEVQFTTSSTAPFTEPAWVHMNYQNSPLPSGYGVQAQEDSQGNVWLAVGGSLVKYTTEGQIVTYNNPDATTEFSSFILENDNAMWVCNRSNGVFKFDGNGNWTQYNTENTSMTSNYIHSIAIDSQGNKWITTNGGGLVKYDNSTWTIWTAENSDLPANSIYSIFIDNDDNVWLGFSGYLAKFDGTTMDVWNGEQTGYGVGGTLSAISIDANDNIWIGKDWNLGVARASISNLTSWTQYNYSNSSYPESRAVAIDFDAEGRVWFGTETKGLVVFDGVEWSVFNSETSTSWPSSSCDWVTSFFTDTKSVRWVGTHDGFILTNSIVPTVTTSNVSEVTETSATAGGTVDFYGGADITAKGVVWSTSISPTLDANNGFTSDGTGTTEFNSDLTGLDAATTYYVRSYATNSAGTGYGNEVQFTTQETSVDATPLPFIEDFESGIGDWSVLDQDEDGEAWYILNDPEYAHSGNNSARIKYNSSGNNDWLISPLLDLPAGESIQFSLWARSYGSTFPESFDIKVIANDGQQIYDIATGIAESDIYTEFTYDLSSYAGQQVKIAIVCVSVDQFYLYVDDVSCVVGEASIELPTLITTTVTNITQNTASSGGAITDDGGADITAKGVVWSTSESPTLASNDGYSENGTGTAEFTSELTGLTANTTYYVRAYATNSAGTAYGDQKSFTTTPTSVGIESVENLSIYPNPFTSTLTLESEKGISQVVVMNVSGQVVLAKQANGQSKLVLEADDLDSGLYIVSLTEVDGTNSHIRVVKR